MSEEFQFAKREKPRPYNFNIDLKIPEYWNDIIIPLGLDKKVILDAGCGVGEWSIQEAKKNPHDIYIGIEKTKERSSQLIQSKIDENLDNYFAIRADVILFLQTMVPENSIDEIYFFHPNPWPKLRQANKRYFVSSSFSVFKKVLKKDGQIYLASNTSEYVEEAYFFLKNYWGFKLQEISQYKNILEPRTPFERKYIDRKQNIYQLQAKL